MRALQPRSPLERSPRDQLLPALWTPVDPPHRFPSAARSAGPSVDPPEDSRRTGTRSDRDRRAESGPVPELREVLQPPGGCDRPVSEVLECGDPGAPGGAAVGLEDPRAASVDLAPNPFLFSTRTSSAMQKSRTKSVRRVSYVRTTGPGV